jgi:toluene monooxygenase system protein A
MGVLKREDWYDLARETNWTPKFVSESELFPEELSGSMGIPAEVWETWDEPYKVTFTEYMETQRQKDAGAYSVKAALSRSSFFDSSPPGWKSVLKAHYGAIALGEYAAATAEARMARFARAPGNRNMATFGMLDEIRHGQIQLWFPHELCIKDRQFDWAHKAYHTNEWGAIAAKAVLDDMMMARSATEVAIMLTFAFETGFTNLQFLALASDAAEAGDHTFSTLISSIQTDESRHAQQGAPTLRILVEQGHVAEAQQMIDATFWRSWRLFSLLTGISMDYYTPLSHRKRPFKDFVKEWIVNQFERAITDLGLKRPWYWDNFLRTVDTYHHDFHMGIWYWRPTVWWNVPAGVTPDERDWLEDNYPGWNDTYGRMWDVIGANIVDGKMDLTGPATLPLICNMCQIPITGTPHAKWSSDQGPRDYYLDHAGRRYHFCSNECRWIFTLEPDRYAGHLTVVDRFLAGKIQPMDLMGALQYMSLAPGEMGDDADGYTWGETYRNHPRYGHAAAGLVI